MHDMLRCGAQMPALAALLQRYRLRLSVVDEGESIPGSYWGDTEAGLIEDTLYVRADTPLHSALHEACHWICMSPDRRAGLHTDAKGDDLEECAVNYLQILLADEIPGFGRARMCADMDAWGYSFRLGSAQAWFVRDARDASDWLLRRALITESGRPSYQSIGAP